MDINDNRNGDIIKKSITIKTEYTVTEHEGKIGIEHMSEWENGTKDTITDDIYHNNTKIEEIYIKSEPVDTSESEDELESVAVTNTGKRHGSTDGVYLDNSSRIDIKSEPEDTSECEGSELNNAAVTNSESLYPFWPYCTSSTDDMSQHDLNTSIRTEEVDVKSKFVNGNEQGDSAAGQDTVHETSSSSPDESYESSIKNKCQPTKTSSNECNICKKTFVQARYLAKHKRIHSGEKPFKCDQCDKAFSQSSNLFSHKRIHSGEKSFICEQCNKAFSRSGHLIRHKRTHSGERPFKCDQCNKAFLRSSDLVGHKRLHTGEKPFKCEQCDKAFSQAAHLITHKRVHTGEKPFKCDLCNKAFSRSEHLIRHKRIHSGEKPFKCDQCDKEFALAQYLNAHKRTHMSGK